MAVLTNLLFVITFGLTVTTEVDLQKRIIGGRDCLDHERPYHVRFENPRGFFFCGGSLISDRWILTAAHCWKGNMIPVLSPHQGPRQNVSFVANYTFEDVDLMLVKLQNTTNIQHIPLPDCANRRLRGGDVVQIAGYGSNQVGPGNRRDNDVEAAVLQCANFTVVGQRRITGKPSNRTSECFQVNTTRVDTSPGDSGGGVVFNNAIYGVVQGSANGTHAHAGPANFVDVCHYMDWITNITGIRP